MEREIITDEQTYKTVLGAVVKCIAIICLTIAIMFFGHSCNLDAATIQECKSACSSVDSQMHTVTYRECTCEEKNGRSEWVLPRR